MKAITNHLRRIFFKKINLKELEISSGNILYKKAKKVIPGGTQLLSKRPEMFAPEIWPSYYSRAKGSKIWDLDNRKFLDMSIMGVGANILGYSIDEVDNAVFEAIKKGVSSSLNCPEEVYLAEKLIDLHPWFQMVRYARSGGEAISIAIRIARAKTGKEKVLFSGYHGWTDWYLSANISSKNALDNQLMSDLSPRGIPLGLEDTAIPFLPNSIDSLRKKIVGQEGQIAAIIIEPARGEDAPKGYLESLKGLCEELGAILIFDEITSGFRMCAGGIHRNYKVHPDIAVFAKGMSNGYAMSAVLGKENVMQSAQKTFISSTNWTEKIGPVAALATLEKYQKESVDKKIIHSGKRVKSIWDKAAKKNGLEISISGLPSLCSFSFNYPNQNLLNTVFTTKMLEMGILGFRQFKPSYSHSEKDIKMYEKAVSHIFEYISKNKDALNYNYPLHHQGFKRLTKE